MTTLESKSAFARRLGVAPSYVTKLAHDGRLVLVDGQIEVETSLALIETTKDPNRDDVRQRHAKARDERRQATRQDKPADVPAATHTGRSPTPAPMAKPTVQAATVFREARADRTHYQARQAEIRLAKLQGKLVDVKAVRKIAGNDGAMIRTLLENLPDQAAPRLAPVRDPQVAARILKGLLDDVQATMADLLMKNIAAIRRGADDGEHDAD